MYEILITKQHKKRRERVRLYLYEDSYTYIDNYYPGLYEDIDMCMRNPLTNNPIHSSISVPP